MLQKILGKDHFDMLTELCLVEISSAPHTWFPSHDQRGSISWLDLRLSGSLTFVHSNISVNLQCSPSLEWKKSSKRRKYINKRSSHFPVMFTSDDCLQLELWHTENCLIKFWMKDFAHCWRFYSCSLATAGPFLIEFQL